MATQTHTIYQGAVNPEEYPHDRLVKERVALLRCVDDKALPHTLGPGSVPEVGKHYLAISSYHGNFFDFKADSPVFWAHIVDQTGRKKCSFPYEDFVIEDDPWSVTERRQGLSWFYYNRNQWLRTRLANRDHSQDMVHEDYLRENKLALVQYVGDKYNSYPFEVGQQLFALSHEPDFTPGAIYVIAAKDDNGSPHAKWMRSALFEILSDPLGLLDPAQTESEDVIAMQKEVRPQWFSQATKRTGITTPANQTTKD